MKHISSRITLYSFLYLFILFVIFFLQFRKGTSFYYESSHLNVQGRFFINDEKEKELLLPLHITSNGLSIFITQEEPIKALMQDGSVKEIKLLSYQTNENTFVLLCENGIKIDFTANNLAILERSEPVDFLHIKSHLSDDIKQLYLSYKLTQNARPIIDANNTMVQYQNKTYAFSKRQGMKDSKTKDASVIAFSKDYPSIDYSEHFTKIKLNLDVLLKNRMASKELYETNLNIFAQNSLERLEKQVKEKKHNAKTIVAIFAEYGKRGEYEKAIRKYPQTVLSKQEYSYLTLPFYGNIMENYNKKLLDDSKTLQTIQKKLESRDVSVFDIPNIFSFLNNRREDALLLTLVEFLEKIDEKMDENTLYPYRLANILDFYIEYTHVYKRKHNLDSLVKKIESSILDSLFEIDDRLYVQTKEGEMESFSVFSISSSLIRYGNAQKNEQLCRIGYFLFNSLYSLTDEPTSFPSSYQIKENEGKKKELMVIYKNILGVEELYPIVFYNNTWYTHERNIFQSEGKNIFALTCCGDIKVNNKNKNSLSFEFVFPKRAIHHVVLEGVDAFESMQIGSERNYKTDENFERYPASGYVHARNKKTLYLKVKHTDAKMKINLFY